MVGIPKRFLLRRPLIFIIWNQPKIHYLILSIWVIHSTNPVNFGFIISNPMRLVFLFVSSCTCATLPFFVWVKLESEMNFKVTFSHFVAFVSWICLAMMLGTSEPKIFSQMMGIYWWLTTGTIRKKITNTTNPKKQNHLLQQLPFWHPPFGGKRKLRKRVSTQLTTWNGRLPYRDPKRWERLPEIREAPWPCQQKSISPTSPALPLLGCNKKSTVEIPYKTIVN